MKQLLTALAVLTLTAACSSTPTGPSVTTPGGDLPNLSANAVTLSGFVSQMTADGAVPVEGATVDLAQDVQSGMAPAHARTAARPADSTVLMTTWTDASGHYEFAGISAGTYSLRITKAGFAPYDSGEFSFSGDTEVDAQLTLDPNASTERARRVRR